MGDASTTAECAVAFMAKALAWPVTDIHRLRGEVEDAAYLVYVASYVNEVWKALVTGTEDDYLKLVFGTQLASHSPVCLLYTLVMLARTVVVNGSALGDARGVLQDHKEDDDDDQCRREVYDIVSVAIKPAVAQLMEHTCDGVRYSDLAASGEDPEQPFFKVAVAPRQGG